MCVCVCVCVLVLLSSGTPHPRILKVLGVSEESETQWLVITELCPMGHLGNVLSSDQHRRHMTWKNRKRMAIEAASGMSHMHSPAVGIAHLDLKPQNLLVTKNYHIAIADFGGARRLEDLKSQQANVIGTPISV